MANVSGNLPDGMVRIIGIELRMQDTYTGTQEELALIPCDILVKNDGAENRGYEKTFNVTIHTSEGDSNSQNFSARCRNS